jgi:hypothetical protein
MTRRQIIGARIAVLGVVVAIASLAAAQTSTLSPAQLQTLKNDIVADGTLNANPNTPDGNTVIAAAYSATAAPDFWVWRTKVSRDELVGATSVDGTTFNWTGAGYITRSQGERDAFTAIFDSDGNVNAARPQVRQAFLDIFSGATAPAPANRTHLTTVARRKATRLEKLFATGTGSTASPATLTIEGAISYPQVDAARRLP